MTNTTPHAFGFTFAPETDPGPYGGIAADIASAIDGAWKLSRYTESMVVIKDHRDDPEGIAIARVGCEWLDNVAASGRDYDEELQPEVPTVRQTACRLCGLDVEVALDDIGLLSTDRGGSASCPDGKAHDPALDAEDYDAHEYWVGDVAR